MSKDVNNPSPWNLRIWDVEKGEWLCENDPDALVFYGFDIRGGEVTCQGVMDWLYDEIFKGRKLIWERSTGLVDEIGKEIYEGDIIRARWYRSKNSRLDTTGEIKFNDGWFYINDDPDGQDRLGVPIHNCYNLEVIGNIHESPELMKEENV